MNYQAKDGIEFPNISKMPFVVLKASTNKVRNLVRIARDDGIPYGTFTETMTVGGWEDQDIRTRETNEEEHNFFGVILMGETQRITELTKKFSLWRV